MNRRQRKKQFKKIYGMNPNQYEKWLEDHWKEIMVAAIARTSETIKTGFNQLGKEVVRYIAAYNLQKGENDDGENGINS